MELVLVGFLGVLLGAGITLAATLLLLQRSADRDLVERRLRALVGYREAMGAEGALRAGPKALLDGAELEQLVHNLEKVAEEFRLTAWIFNESVRGELARPILAFEEEMRRARGRGELPSALRILDSCRQLEVTLRQAASRSVREFRRWRFWPSARATPPASSGESGSDDGGPGGPPVDAGLSGVDVPAH
jgi:hypothetical protein